MINMEEHKQAGLEDMNPHRADNASIIHSNTLFGDSVIRIDRDFNVKNQVVIDDYELKILGGLRFNRKAFDTTVDGSVYSVTRKDYYIGVTNLSYAPTVGLPSPKDAGPGKTYLVKDEAGGAASTTITVRSTGDALIDGGTSATMTGNYDSRMFYSNGSQWYIGGI